MIDQFKKDKILIPGEVMIESVIITSYNGFQIDIKNHMSEIVIQESMDSYCLSGYIMIADNLNFIRNIPLIGNERVSISYYTPSRNSKINKTFFCYKIDALQDAENNKNSMLYRLHFISEEYINSIKKKISLAFRDKKYSEIAKDIYSKYLNTNKPFTVQETIDKTNVTIPYNDPMFILNFLASRSVSFDSKDKTYFFYEDLDGFNFCNILYKTKGKIPVAEYTWFTANISETRDPLVIKNLEKEFYRIESYNISDLNNSIVNVQNGLYSSMILSHDITYKTVDVAGFSYNNDYLKLNKIYGNGYLPKNNDKFSNYNMSHCRLYPKQAYVYDDVEMHDNYDKIVLEKNSHLNQLQNNRINILVAGDTDRRVGELVTINIPSAQPSLQSEENYDPYFSGKYIITKITHMISPISYKMRLYLERDSLPLSYPEQKTVEVKI